MSHMFLYSLCLRRFSRVWRAGIRISSRTITRPAESRGAVRTTCVAGRFYLMAGASLSIRDAGDRFWQTVDALTRGRAAGSAPEFP